MVPMCWFDLVICWWRLTCLTSSVLTLSAISCDRFIAIMFPLHVRITKQRTGAVITMVWLVSMAVSVPFLIFNKHYVFKWNNFEEPSCGENWPAQVEWIPHLRRCVKRYPSKQLYYTFVSLTLFFFPVVIMATAYFLIIGRLWMSELPGERNVANINVQHRAKKKVIKMVCVVLCAFVICWMPMQVTVFYSQFGHSSQENGELPEWFSGFSYFAMYLAYSNSALNPIIYGGFNKNFRQGLCNVLRCSYRRPNLGRPQFSQKSRNTTTSAILGSPSSFKVNGVSSTKIMELRPLPDQTSRNDHLTLLRTGEEI